MKVFRDVSSLLPDEVGPPETIAPETLVSEALTRMIDCGRAHLPVVSSNVTRGVFSLWALARNVHQTPELPLSDLAVEQLMDRDTPSVKATDSLEYLMRLLHSYEAVLVVSPHGVQGVVTHADLLAYYDRVARPFLLIQEIELALRSLIDISVADLDLARCIATLRSLPGTRQPPRDMSDWNLNHHISLVVCEENWQHFADTFGGNRDRALAKLDIARRIRNRVFHFHPEAVDIRRSDLETLQDVRDWLRLNAERSSGPREGGNRD